MGGRRWPHRIRDWDLRRSGAGPRSTEDLRRTVLCTVVRRRKVHLRFHHQPVFGNGFHQTHIHHSGPARLRALEFAGIRDRWRKRGRTCRNPIDSARPRCCARTGSPNVRLHEVGVSGEPVSDTAALNVYFDPPAIEGTSSTSSPSWNEYEEPPMKRMSSSFT